MPAAATWLSTAPVLGSPRLPAVKPRSTGVAERFTTGRLVMALRLIENEWRKPKGEGPLQPDTPLQIEHILPQD
jgi:hypothetical protein